MATPELEGKIHELRELAAQFTRTNTVRRFCLA